MTALADAKLLKLRSWLTLQEAAAHISSLMEETVVEADVLRLAIDGKLTLSLRLVNRAWGQSCRFRGIEDGGYLELTEEEARAVHGAAKPNWSTHWLVPCGVELGENRVLVTDHEQPTAFEPGALFDVTGFGSSMRELERRYQQLVGGPNVDLLADVGAVVYDYGGERYVKFVEWFDENPFAPGSPARLDAIKKAIQSGKFGDEWARRALERHKDLYERFGAAIEARPMDQQYLTAYRFPTGSVLVVRTAALLEFQSAFIADASTKSGLQSGTRDSTYLNTIGALLAELGTKEEPLINALVEKYPKVPGLGRRTLQDLFAKAKRSLQASG